MPRSLVIMSVIPDPDDGKEWFVQYVIGSVCVERRFSTFAEVSAFVEGELLADDEQLPESISDDGSIAKE